MEKFYIRSQDLEQKIHSVKLPYLAWKVLFLLGEKQSASTLATILGDDSKAIEAVLTNLLNEKLVTEVTEEKPSETVEEEAEKVEEEVEAAKEEVEAVEEEEAEVKEEIEEPEVEEPETEEKIIAEETESAIPEQEKEEATISELEEEPTLEEGIKGIEDFDFQSPEEELAEETETEGAEVESEIELPQLDEETEKLDINFENIEEPEVAEEEKQVEEIKPVEEEKPVEEKTKPSGTPTLLVIDDSIVIRKMVELALEGEDLILESATSGKEGLKALDEVKPDVVILDLMLPDINGIDLLKTIKASLNIPVIMLSGKDSPQMIEKAKAEGADSFLPKPFRDEDLVKTIKELLQK